MGQPHIPLKKEHGGTLNMTQGLNIDRLEELMMESHPDKVLKDWDGQTATNAPWQRNSSKNTQETTLPCQGC